MGECGNGSLAERVERLEREVEELRDGLRRMSRGTDRTPAAESRRARSAHTTPSPIPETATAAGPGPERTAREHPDTGWGFGIPFDVRDLSRGEWWLNKVGIGLLLFGVAFLFMLSVERGWIPPAMRVGFGLAIGGTLLALGLRVYEGRRAFAQVLLGGGIGALYITGFAASQLYGLAPYPLAFAFMVAVTLLAYFLSLRQDEAPLSVVGSLGGLGTPFLLYNDAGSLGGLVLYTCLILAGMGAVYFYKGWASLLAVSSVGGWLVFLIGYLDSLSLMMAPSPGDRTVLQLGVIFAWLLLWLAPVAREVLRGSERSLAHAYIVSTPIIALGFTGAIWELSNSGLAWISLPAAILYALAALALRRSGSDGFSRTHALVGLLFLTYTLVLVLDGDALFIALAAEAAILHYVARRYYDGIVSAGAHLLFCVAGLWLASRLVSSALGFPGAVRPALFDASSLFDLAVIALSLAASRQVTPRSAAWIYGVLAHAAVLAWLWRGLSELPGGDGWVTVAWGLYAVGLLVAGLRLDRAWLVRGGLTTLFLVVGKLFLVDLAEVEAIWRVLLFLGFGGLFLVLSYFLRSLWRPGSGAEEGRQ
ncbi:DUF2339 domain-containing protein [soil metagenome]